MIFPFEQFWWLYASFLGFVFLALAIDLGVFNRKAHVVKFKEAFAMTIVWVTLALLFNFALYQYLLGKTDPSTAKQLSLEFLTGYVIEQSLSVDNLFVFIVVFSYFKIPPLYQHRVLFFGILGALFFRGVFIAAGSFLMQFHLVIVLFGVFLIFTGGRMLFKSEDEEMHPENNIAIKLLKKFYPVTTQIHGQKFFIKEHGKKYATPLFVCLLVLEATDIVFALDSVPAIFAITKEPFIVFTSNIFAILGLRSMFFVLSGVMDKFHFLKVGLAVVLIFVGLKMVWLDSVYNGKFPITWSLGFIGTVLTVSVLASILFPEKEIKK